VRGVLVLTSSSECRKKVRHTSATWILRLRAG
jgi:hypothetical protein